MTVREIQGHLQEMYGAEVSPSLISSVTDAVMDEAKAWQARPLEALYPIVYLDCIHVKTRDSGAVRAKAVYLALGINMAGEKEILGLWIAQTEGAKFWLQVVTELKNRGVADIFIACVDGLKGFPEAIEAVYPKTAVQLCIVHMVRHSLNYVSWKRRKEVAADLRRARACGMSLIPTTTGSATAITLIYPELKGRLNGHAVRVPLLNASLTDCVFELERATTAEEVNALFKAAADGKVTLIPVGEGAPVLGNLLVYINFGIEETLPDGKIVSNPVRADTLETADPALDKLGKCILRGKTAGNASLEITIEQSRGIVFVGSRVLDPSTLTNPVRCFVTVVFPNVNPPAMAANNPEEVNERDAKRAAKKEAKAAEDKLKGDSVDLKWTDGKRQKLTFEKVVDAAGKDPELHSLMLQTSGPHFCTGLDLSALPDLSDGDLLLRLRSVALT